MRSFLLGRLAPMLAISGVIVGLGLLVKGHDTPGGGFVAGISFALVVVLLVAGRGASWFRRQLRVDPESLLLVGIAILFSSAFGPVLFGRPALSQGTWEVVLPLGFEWKLQSALLFDGAVGLTIASGITSAALVLWERLALEEKIEP